MFLLIEYVVPPFIGDARNQTKAEFITRVVFIVSVAKILHNGLTALRVLTDVVRVVTLVVGTQKYVIPNAYVPLVTFHGIGRNDVLTVTTPNHEFVDFTLEVLTYGHRAAIGKIWNTRNRHIVATDSNCADTRRHAVVQCRNKFAIFVILAYADIYRVDAA